MTYGVSDMKLQKNQGFGSVVGRVLSETHLRFDVFLLSILYAFRSYKMLKD